MIRRILVALSIFSGACSMATEMPAVPDMNFIDRSVGVRNSATPDIVSLESGIACAVTFQHDLGVDLSRTRYTGAGKFCMPVTDGQLSHFHKLAEVLATEYTPDPSSALPNAAFDYKFSYQGKEYLGSYPYDGGEDFDRSLAPFDVLLRDLVKNGNAVASVSPSFHVSRAGTGLVVDFLIENIGRVDVTLTGLSKWAALSESPDTEGVTFGLSLGSAPVPVIVGHLSSSNYSGDSSLLDGPIFLRAGETRSLRFAFPSREYLDGAFPPGSYIASGSIRIEAKFDGGVSGRLNTPVNPVNVEISE